MTCVEMDVKPNTQKMKKRNREHYNSRRMCVSVYFGFQNDSKSYIRILTKIKDNSVKQNKMKSMFKFEENCKRSLHSFLHLAVGRFAYDLTRSQRQHT